MARTSAESVTRYADTIKRLRNQMETAYTLIGYQPPFRDAVNQALGKAFLVRHRLDKGVNTPAFTRTQAALWNIINEAAPKMVGETNPFGGTFSSEADYIRTMLEYHLDEHNPFIHADGHQVTPEEYAKKLEAISNRIGRVEASAQEAGLLAQVRLRLHDKLRSIGIAE